MKRAGYLTEAIGDPDNLRLAFWKAKKKKAGKEDAEAYGADLDRNLLMLRGEILSGAVSVGDYSYFKVYDPKERVICAASFRERVLHHAIMNICDPVFEKFQIHDSYATRVGKGQFAALDRVKSWIGGDGQWFCKLDMRKYFDSISHEVLYGRLCEKFKDARVLGMFKRIIDSYATAPGRGVPIGNLTSQYFANFYLAHLDHFAKEELGVKKYARYMDDVVMLDMSKEKLKDCAGKIQDFCERKLQLALKPVCLNRVDRGIPFLGYVLFPRVVRLTKSSKKRFLQKDQLYAKNLRTGVWSQKEYARHAEPLYAFTRFASTLNIRRRAIEKTEVG